MENTGATVSGVLKLFMPMLVQTPADGAMGITRGCFDAGANTGDFYGPGAMGYTGDAVLIPPESKCTDDESKKMLWELSEAAIGESFEV